MKRMGLWFGSVPVGVWLFLAATQILALVGTASRLDTDVQMLRRLPDHPAYDSLRERSVQSRDTHRIQLVGATVLLPLFLIAAFRRRSPMRAACTSRCDIVGTAHADSHTPRP